MKQAADLLLMPICQLNVPTDFVQRCHRLGIVVYGQLLEFADRQDARLGVLFDRPVDQAHRLVYGLSKHAVASPNSRRFRRSRFRMPPVNGIRGPMTLSDRIMAGRRQTVADRKFLVAKLCALRERADLPTKQLVTEYMTPVGNEGSSGFCTGWGSTGAREFFRQGEELSPLFAYAMAKALDGAPDVQGSWQYFCFLGFAEIGHVRDRDCPYTDHPQSLEIDPYRDSAAEFRVPAYADVLLEREDRHLQSTLLKAILAGELGPDMGPAPVSVSLAVYPPWNTTMAADYGLIALPTTGEECLGGHAMTLVGYIEAGDLDGLYDTTFFVCKNSWSEKWARHSPIQPGYALIPEAYLAAPDLLWESLVVVGEESPVGGYSPRWLRPLKRQWDSKLVAAC